MWLGIGFEPCSRFSRCIHCRDKCFDAIDNDLDGKIDADDTDCAGQYYSIRRAEGIDSAFLGDPCFNNVCRVCVGGTDNNNDGICDAGDADGVNVRYLNQVQPGKWFRAKFLKSSGVQGETVRLSINYLNESMGVRQENASIQQLPNMELGGCTAGTNCRSVTATTYNPPNPDEFSQTGLNEKIEFNISSSSVTGPYRTSPQEKAYQDYQHSKTWCSSKSIMQQLYMKEIIQTTALTQKTMTWTITQTA